MAWPATATIVRQRKFSNERKSYPFDIGCGSVVFLCTKICCLSGSNGAEPWSMHNPVLTQIVFGDRLRELADVQLPRTAAGLTFNGSDKLKFHLNFKF